MQPAEPIRVRLSEPLVVQSPWLYRLDLLLRRLLRLESGANVFPLLHVAAYFFLLALAAVPGLVTSGGLLAALFVLISLMGYSLSIGVLHMHAHRKLFTSRTANRLVEFLLCFPCMLSYPMMKHVHVSLHHKHANGPQDPTTTFGYERGWRAAWYWVRYAYVCQRATLTHMFGRNDRQTRMLRRQYLVDSGGTLLLVSAYALLVDMERMLLFWELPLILVSVNIGFFAWLSHAPASHLGAGGSFNTTNNVMNLLMHNQGYHLVHHRFPGIHWTRIPECLDIMMDVEDRLIAPYWVVLVAAWRVVLPRYLYDARAGKEWKVRFASRKARCRIRLAHLPYFGWV